MPPDVIDRRLALLAGAWRFFDEVAARGPFVAHCMTAPRLDPASYSEPDAGVDSPSRSRRRTGVPSGL